MSLQDFRERIGTIADVLASAAALGWDMRTMMPAGGAEARGRQLASLTTIARDLLLCADLQRALDGAERETRHLADDAPDRRATMQVRQAIDHHRRLDTDLVHRRTALKAPAQAAWALARARSDFSLFAPLLAETIALARAEAECLGYDGHPHDALLAAFEPGERGSTLQPLFAELRAGLLPLIRTAAGRQPPLAAAEFAVERQHAFTRRVVERFGYDFGRGRLDQTLHPFETAMTRDDVRITARYDRAAVAVGLKAAMHEAGHGLYDQNVDPGYTRTALTLDLVQLTTTSAPSLGTHESQSRLWENHVGRSRGFWAVQFPLLRDIFPDALGTVTAEGFRAAFNRVAPGPIRVEADELSYDLHIMLRVELERALLDGSLRVSDLPQAWSEAMRRDLDVTVADDAEGVLQDIHWSLGLFGSFASYTIGNVMAAQLWQAVAAADPQVRSGADAGDYAPLRAALTDAVHRHGRRFNRDELLLRITGGPLSAKPYLAGLAARYGTAIS